MCPSRHRVNNATSEILSIEKSHLNDGRHRRHYGESHSFVVTEKSRKEAEARDQLAGLVPAISPAPRLIGTPRKRTISAREVCHGQSSEGCWSAAERCGATARV